jgi:hypothetical protein
VQSASAVRGLNVRRPVPCQLKTRKEVERYIAEKLKTEIPREKILNEEKLYKALGLFPEDFNYEKTLVALYGEQVAGYYDPRAKYYAMAAWIPAAFQLPIAVHELTHALQDQHFDLEKLTEPSKEINDTALARAALVEGDASAVMIDYNRKLWGQQQLAEDESISAVVMQHLLGTTLTPSIRTAPPAVQSLIIFPYLSGLNFVHFLLRHGGYRRVSEAYQRPPDTTEEILHPEKYLQAKKDFVTVDMTPSRKRFGVSDTTLRYHDILGEFTISTFLTYWIPVSEAVKAASGWGGDRI